MKAKKQEQQRFACLKICKLDDLVEGAQAKTTKYAPKYALNIFQNNFCINYHNHHNQILKITFCIFKRMYVYNKIKRELQTASVSNGRSVAVFWLSNVQKNDH